MVATVFHEHTNFKTITDKEVLKYIQEAELPPNWDVVKYDSIINKLFGPGKDKSTLYALYIYIGRGQWQDMTCVRNKDQLITFIMGYRAGLKEMEQFVKNHLQYPELIDEEIEDK